MSVSASMEFKIDWEIQEDGQQLADFEARIDTGQIIEPDDWLPHNYRIGMLRMAEHHANSEIVGALPEGEWITRAPSLRRKLALIAKVQDEVGHGQMLYRVSQDLGKPRDQMLRDLITGKTKYHNVFNYPAPTWADVTMIQRSSTHIARSETLMELALSGLYSEAAVKSGMLCANALCGAPALDKIVGLRPSRLADAGGSHSA